MLLSLAVVMGTSRRTFWLLICLYLAYMSGSSAEGSLNNDALQNFLQWYVTPTKIFNSELVVGINTGLEEIAISLKILKTLLTTVQNTEPRHIGIDFKSKVNQLSSSLTKVYSTLGHDTPDIIPANIAHELTRLSGINVTAINSDNFEKSHGILYEPGKLLRKINEHSFWHPNWATMWVSRQPGRLIKSVRG